MGCSSSTSASDPYVSVTPDPPPESATVPVGTPLVGHATTIRAACGNCGNQFLVSQAGVRVACPQCGALNDVPIAPTGPTLKPSMTATRSKTHHLLETSDSKTIEQIKEALDDVVKRPCKYGLGCYRRNGEHLETPTTRMMTCMPFHCGSIRRSRANS